MGISGHGINTNSSDEKVTDHDLLIGVCKDICWLKKIMGNHLAHHWVTTISVAGALLAAIGTLLMYIITGN